MIGHLELAIGTLTSHASWVWLKYLSVKSDFSQMRPSRSGFDYECRAFHSDWSRLHLDLIFCYKIVFGLVSVNFNDSFEYSSTTTTRGHAYKLFKPRCTSGVQQNFFYWACDKSVEQSATNCQFHISVFVSTNNMWYWFFWFCILSLVILCLCILGRMSVLLLWHFCPARL